MGKGNTSQVISDVLRMSAEGDYIYLDFGHTTKKNANAAENVTFTNQVIIHSDNLMGIIGNLVKFGYEYQKEFEKDIGLPRS